MNMKRWVTVRKRMVEQGYVLDAKGKFLHREVCRKAHGDYPRHWAVHHIDCDRKNNSPDNLIALPREFHNQIHNIMRRDNFIMTRANIEHALCLYRPRKLTKKQRKCARRKRRKERGQGHRHDNGVSYAALRVVFHEGYVPIINTKK